MKIEGGAECETELASALIIILLILSTTIGIVGDADQEAWPMFKSNPQHTGSVKYPGTRTPWLRWKFKTDGIIESSPVIASDGTIYFGSNDGYLYAVHTNGSLKWTFKTGGSIKSTPAIDAESRIRFGSDDGYLYVIDSNGTLRFRFKTNGHIRSSPTIGPDGTIYFGSSDNYLYALNPDGSLK
ncbi:MAG: outer membrane protein assembly factor BamB family protein [Thermoproteota archaeon]